MRAREFIFKEDKEYNPKNFRNDAMSALPDCHVWPDLDNSSGYLAYRFGVAMAGMPDQKMAVAGPTNVTGSGAVAGLGQPPGSKSGEPPVRRKRNPIILPMGRRNPPKM